MGCQSGIASKANYVFAVKENQPTLHVEISEYFRFLDEARRTFPRTCGKVSWKKTMGVRSAGASVLPATLGF